MYNFIYEGAAIDDTDINESVSFKIEDDIMTLYEDGRLVDNASLVPGTRVGIDISKDESAQIVFIEAKIDEEKGAEVLRSLGLTDEQINTISSNNDYAKFINILRSARKEVELNSVKEVLRTSLGMSDEQINKLIETNSKDFTGFTRIINKGKQVVEKDAATNSEPAGDDLAADAAGNAEVPTDASAPVEAPADGGNATPADNTEVPAENPAEPSENEVPPTDATGSTPEEQSGEISVPNAGEIQPAEQNVASTSTNPASEPIPEAPAEAPTEEPPVEEPSTDANTELAPEEKEESVMMTESVEDGDTDIVHKANIDAPKPNMVMDEPSKDIVSSVHAANVEEDSAATIGPMLPQIGSNEFNMDNRAGTSSIPTKNPKGITEEDDTVEEGVALSVAVGTGAAVVAGLWALLQTINLVHIGEDKIKTSVEAGHYKKIVSRYYDLCINDEKYPRFSSLKRHKVFINKDGDDIPKIVGALKKYGLGREYAMFAYKTESGEDVGCAYINKKWISNVDMLGSLLSDGISIHWEVSKHFDYKLASKFKKYATYYKACMALDVGVINDSMRAIFRDIKQLSKKYAKELEEYEKEKEVKESVETAFESADDSIYDYSVGIVEESIGDIANSIKTSVELSAHIKKLAVEIAVLNSKLYVAKRYSDNKLKAINIERRMLRLQRELNTIKNAATKKEKAAIMKLQKEAFAKSKAEAIARAEKKKSLDKVIATESVSEEVANENKTNSMTESIITSVFKKNPANIVKESASASNDNKDTSTKELTAKEVASEASKYKKEFSDMAYMVLGEKRIAKEEEVADFEFSKKNLIPAVFCGDNDYICYNTNSGKWTMVNIVDGIMFNQKPSIDKYIKNVSKTQESANVSDLEIKYEKAKALYESTGERKYANKMKGLKYFIEKAQNETSNTVATVSTGNYIEESALDGEGFTNFDEAKDMEDEIKPIVDIFNKKGYTVKYASPGHLKLRKTSDRDRDGVYKGNLYTDARVQFDRNYHLPKAPDGWFFRNVDNTDYLDVKEIAYKSSNGTPDTAFKKWKESYMAALKDYANSLDDYAKDETGVDQPEDIKESVEGFESFFNTMMESFSN